MELGQLIVASAVFSRLDSRLQDRSYQTVLNKVDQMSEERFFVDQEEVKICYINPGPVVFDLALLQQEDKISEFPPL